MLGAMSRMACLCIRVDCSLENYNSHTRAYPPVASDLPRDRGQPARSEFGSAETYSIMEISLIVLNVSVLKSVCPFWLFLSHSLPIFNHQSRNIGKVTVVSH